MNIILLMAGSPKDKDENSIDFPSYLTEIGNKPLVQRTIETLKQIADKVICVIRKQDQDKYYFGDTLKIMCPSCQIFQIENETGGAVCSALFAIKEIDNEEELLIIDGDKFIKSDITEAISDFRNKQLDGGLIVFKAIHHRYSSVLLDDNNLVIQTSEKRPISRIASAGCYYFKKGCDFVKSGFSVIEKDERVQNHFYISSTYNEMVLQQKKIGVFEIARKDYLSLSEYRLFERFKNH